MGKTLVTMVDGEGNTLKFTQGTLVRPPIRAEEAMPFSEKNIYRRLTDTELIKEYLIGIKVKVKDFLYRAPKII